MSVEAAGHGVPDRARAGTELDRLDDALFEVRRLLRRPGYRQRLRSQLPPPVDIATVRVLRAVQRAEGSPSIGDIATILGVDPSSASRLVDEAVGLGMLARSACKDDRRRMRLVLTVPGEELLAVATKARREVLAEVTTGWGVDDIRRLSLLLEQLRDGFDRIEAGA